MISGSTICLNAVRRDYCLEACIRSLLDVCDEVVVVDGGSTDGTVELVESIDDDRIRLFHDKVVAKPGGGWRWLRDWSESARLKCRCAMHLYLQADEVLHEDDTDLIKSLARVCRPTIVRRINFWLDQDHFLPPDAGTCNQRVCRLAPTTNEFEVGGDAESLDGQQPVIAEDVRIFHYGFIRDPAAFAEKSRVIQGANFGTCDEIVDRVELDGLEVLAERYPRDTLIPFFGTHPKHAQPWLCQRLANIGTSPSLT